MITVVLTNMLDEAYEKIIRRKNSVTFRCSGYSTSEKFILYETLYNGQTDRAASCIKCKVMRCAQVRGVIDK